AGYTVFAHAVRGEGTFAGTDVGTVAEGETVLFGAGDAVRTTAGPDGFRFLLVSGRPLHEPVAWYGPIVMNTRSELQTAMQELQSGGFLHHRRPIVDE
ncbi:Pirin domain protein, partial [mine drainage metagenome]